MSWDRVGAAIEQRISDLDAKYTAIAKTAGCDQSSLWKARKGYAGDLSEDLRGRIERALRWPAGTLDDIYHGGEPPTEVLTETERLEQLEQRVRSLADQIDRLVDRLDG